MLIFGRSTSVGLLVLGASCFDLGAGAASLVAVVASMVCAAALGYRRDLSEQGFFGYNAALCGLALGHGQPTTLGLLAGAAVLGVVAVLLAASLSDFLDRYLQLPVLALPFVLTTSFLGPAFGNHHTTAYVSATSVPDLPLAMPEVLADTLRAFGAVVFDPTTSAGLLVLLAVVLTSRILAGFAIFGAGIGTLVSMLSHHHLDHAFSQPASYNALLACAALGCVFFVPSVASAAFATVGALVAAWLTVASGPLLARFGQPVLAWPFVIVTLTLLRALALRRPGRAPFAPVLLEANSEANLAYNRMLRSRFGAPGTVRLTMPVKGTWTVTQGFNGPHTHQAPWQYALDFEITDDQGFPFQGEGTRAGDYYCFDAPVSAALAGTVVFAYGDHPDNAPGNQDLNFPYGNVVIIQHSPALFSVLAHLRQGSLTVQVGQVVAAGAVVARCGASGRSPRPHLHLQVQGSGYLGVPTLPFEVSHFAVGRQTTAEYVPFGVPNEGDRVAAAAPAQVPELSILRVGAEWSLASTRTGVRKLRSELSPIGLRSVLDTVTGERLYFSTLDGVATFTTLRARICSPLAALALALPRVPPFGGEVVVNEVIPPEWLLPTWLRHIHGLFDAVGARARALGCTHVARAERELTATTDLELRWLGRVWQRHTASVTIEEAEIASLSLRRGQRLLFEATRSAATHAGKCARRARTPLCMERVLAYLAIFVIASVAVFSLLLSSRPSAARAVPTPLEQSYRFEAAGDLKQAVDAAALAANHSRPLYFPRLRLAYLEARAKLYAASAADYAEAARLAPEAVEPLLGQLESLILAEQYQPALDVTDAILRLDPKNYVAASRRAWALYQLGRYRAAVGQYTAIVELYPGDIEMRLGRAYALSGAKRPVEAALEFRQVLERVPNDRRARTALGLP